MTRGLLVAAGCALAVWALIDPRFRDAESVLTGHACLPLALAAGVWIGASMREDLWKSTPGWMMLAVVGQGIALQLIEAGRPVRYQHYIPLERFWTPWNAAMLTGLAVQALLVAYGLTRRWRALWRGLRQHYGMAGLVAVALLFIGSSAAPSRELPRYLFELLFATFVQAVNVGNIVLVAASIPSAAMMRFGAACDRLLGAAAKRPGMPADDADPGGVDRFALLCAFWVTVLAAALSFWSYQRHPHIPDEVAYLLHARYFADGRMSLPPPPAKDAFHLSLLYYDPHRVYSPVPPGWPAMLAVGVLARAPWLVNPILAGLNILLVYLVMREVASRRTARMVILALAASPWHILMAMNFMTHTFTLTCALVGALGVARARRTGVAAWAWIAGAGIGVLSLIRPLDGVIGAAVVGIWAIAGARRLRVTALLGLVLGTAALGALVFPYNKYLTGDPTRFPIMKYNDEYFGKNSNAYGFGPDRGGAMNWPLDPYPGHGLADAAVNTALNLSSVNVELFGWSTGSLLILGLLVVSSRLERWDFAMLASVAVVIGIHVPYWFSSGPDFGARYWYLALVPLAALTMRAAGALDRQIDPTAGPGEGVVAGRATAAVAALTLIAVTTYIPWRAIDKYYHFRGMRPDVRSLAARYHFGASLVFVRGYTDPDYDSAAIYNPLDWHAPVTIYAWDKDAETRRRALDAYPNRLVWLVNGPTVTGRGFEVVAGPLPAAQVRTLAR